MVIVLVCAASALVGYILGYFVGRWTTEQELEEKRSQLGLDEEQEEDPYDVFYKQ